MACLTDQLSSNACSVYILRDDLTLALQNTLISGNYESLGKKIHACRFGEIECDFLFYTENVILCVLITIASMRRF